MKQKLFTSVTGFTGRNTNLVGRVLPKLVKFSPTFEEPQKLFAFKHKFSGRSVTGEIHYLSDVAE